MKKIAADLEKYHENFNLNLKVYKLYNICKDYEGEVAKLYDLLTNTNVIESNEINRYAFYIYVVQQSIELAKERYKKMLSDFNISDDLSNDAIVKNSMS